MPNDIQSHLTNLKTLTLPTQPKRPTAQTHALSVPLMLQTEGDLGGGHQPGQSRGLLQPMVSYLPRYEEVSPDPITQADELRSLPGNTNNFEKAAGQGLLLSSPHHVLFQSQQHIAQSTAKEATCPSCKGGS